MVLEPNQVKRDFQQEALTIAMDLVEDQTYPTGVKGFVASGSEVCYNNVTIESGSILRVDGVFICSTLIVNGELKLNGVIEIGGI